MAVSIPDFWRLAVESRLLAQADCERLYAEFAGVKGAAEQSNANTLAEWLVAKGILSRYQTRTLLTGQAGRFYFGDYYVYDRVRSKEGRLAGLLRAVHMPTRHPVMLYLLAGPAAEDPQWWQVAVQQIAWACSVGHPFVAQCYQLFEAGRHKVVAIEDLLIDPNASGDPAEQPKDNTLAARLAPGTRLAPADACRVAYQASLGLARLHQTGQIHGSIAPRNIWLSFDGSAKILQTPLAPEPAAGPGPLDWTAADGGGQLLAAADYAAPELAQLGRPPDMQTDVYALGATLYQMLSGWPPFPNGDVASKLARHASEAPPSLEAVGVPQPVAQLVSYLLAKDPAGRYQTAGQAAEALAYFVDPAVASYVPPPLATAALFDQWLDVQPRVPGAAPGAIPTATGLTAYAAAQYAGQAAGGTVSVPQPEAAQNTWGGAAAVQNGAQPAAMEPPLVQPLVQPSAAPDFAQQNGTFAQQGFGQQDFGQPEVAPQSASFFESIQPAAFDPMSFVEPEPAPLAQQGFPDWGAASSTTPSAGGAAVAETAPPVGAAADSSPLGLNLDPMLDAAPRPARTKSRRSSSAAPKAKLSPIALAGIGFGLAVVAAVVGMILVRNLGGGSENNSNNSQVAINETTGSQINSAGKTTDYGKPPGTADSGNKSTGSSGVKTPVSGSTSQPVQTVPDDGISMWASPTAGSPLPLDYVASGAQLILAVRPSNILHRPDGDQLLPALGPWGDNAAHAIKDATGLELNQIDQAMLVIHDPGDGKPVWTAIIRASEKMAADGRLAAWGNPSATTDGDATYYQGPKLSYFLPAKEGGKVLVVGPAAQIKEILHPTDGPPAMPRAMELIMPHTDSDRDVSLVFVPSYLFGDGKSVLAGPLAALAKPLDDFFGSDVGAAELSLHFQMNFFLELRTIGVPGKDSSTVSDDLARQLKGVPTGVENDLDALNLHPYGRKLLRRFPEWMRLLAEYTRSGVEDDEPILRCYLPSIAGPNLIMASELALSEQPVPTAGNVAGGPKKPLSIAEAMKKKTTLSFPRDTLERSLQLLFEDAGINYEILGTDMQLEGITKNQSFGLDEHDKTVEEILQKIMHLANPDGKLVYVIKPKAPGGPEMLFITTRAAAAKRGDKLPAGLATGPAKPTPTKKKS